MNGSTHVTSAQEKLTSKAQNW